jgi:hypothetical protein
MTGVDDGNGEAANRTIVNIPQEARNKAREALKRSTPMPVDASREELMAYHTLLRQQHTLDYSTSRTRRAQATR